jgi:hypothetical protein
MTDTFTPGALGYGRHGTPDYAPQFGVYAENGDARDVATVKGDNAETYAALFAASPDLLEALELAEGWIDAECESEETGEGQQARWILETMRAAIAKAKAVQS